MLKLALLAKLLCIFAFFVHTGSNIWQHYKDEKIIMGERYVNLSTISFPVVFDISISPGLNLTKLNKLGFENTVFYYTGVN